MPLPLVPLIIGGVSAISAAVGVKKGIDAKSDYDLAKWNNEKAKETVDKANKMIEEKRTATQLKLEEYGQEKLNALSGSITDFFNNMERVTDIEGNSEIGYEDLKYFNPSTPAFADLKKVSLEATSMLAGGVAALGSGALLAFGTYNVVMGGLGGLLVTATTGTSLAALSGAAATNATLAWLGGGAIGIGFGVTGGTAVLGGLVAGPALLVGGGIAAKKADEAYWKSKENQDKADTYMKEARSISDTLTLISSAASQMKRLLKEMSAVMDRYNSSMADIMNVKGTSFKQFTGDEKETFYKGMRVAKTLKDVLEAPILKEDGAYNKEITQIHSLLIGKLPELK